ncbi:conserved hypothetical protein [Coccidioides posadasii str. Silveira]|uniref:Uncharacterized protein n=1 Tax=Coccidioides posadasii (strain RMSCC 757 / Silveira) TaxID=443226 RepID=E9DFC5_COCPS|nr:conserved hypothetical protein [Coccidioides posadasii str. Silveira]
MVIITFLDLTSVNTLLIIGKRDRRDYILKSELITATAIMYRQMNEMVYLPESQTHGARLRYKDGLLIVSLFSLSFPSPSLLLLFIFYFLSCMSLPKLIFTLRAIYDLSRDNYDKNTVYTVMEWIRSPPRPQSTKLLQSTDKTSAKQRAPAN